MTYAARIPARFICGKKRHPPFHFLTMGKEEIFEGSGTSRSREERRFGISGPFPTERARVLAEKPRPW